MSNVECTVNFCVHLIMTRYKSTYLSLFRGVDWGVVPMEEPLPLRGLRPLLLQIIQEGPPGL